MGTGAQTEVKGSPSLEGRKLEDNLGMGLFLKIKQIIFKTGTRVRIKEAQLVVKRFGKRERKIKISGENVQILATRSVRPWPCRGHQGLGQWSSRSLAALMRSCLKMDSERPSWS